MIPPVPERHHDIFIVFAFIWHSICSGQQCLYLNTSVKHIQLNFTLTFLNQELSSDSKPESIVWDDFFPCLPVVWESRERLHRKQSQG